ncbi:CYTH and CHAD domain-containing protein [Arthrobacter zhaoguopingii]|uniref:CYTH and CHAD domain-containing protein n=1 Tax=Arthrobacter zhaoguopingii TaxID=2681491 RepID=UPI001359FAC9|nr:CYTH and CHAD domain-containing protein [Arthrobacter zhaoguopingii]
MDPTPVVEIERKYDVGDGTAVPPLEHLPGVARVDPPAEHRLEATYFDTADLLLASLRITLRRRTGGGDAGWHLKLPLAADERCEYREPLGVEPDGVPEPLLRLIRVHSRDAALVPVVRLRTRRTVHRLRGESDDVLAEFSEDRVKAKVLAPKGSELHWREWEFELVDGSRELLDAGQELLAAAGVRLAGHSSTLARALGPRLNRGTAALPPPKRKASAADVLLAYLREHVEALKDEDPRVRLDAHAAVHGMRVATRRIRSVLATYRELLADADAVNFLRQELKWLAGVLGEARDAEVMHERLKDLVAAEPVELVMGPVVRRIDLQLGADYHKAHTDVVNALNGQRYFRLLDALEALLAAPALTPLASGRAHKVIPKLIRRDVKRLRKAARKAVRHTAGTGDDPALHEARKDGKRLRYAAEAAAPINPARAAQLADAAHGVQKILGDHQDSVVTRELLRRLGAEAFLEGENGFTFGRLHALEQSRALKAEARFHREWKNFRTPPLKK